MLAWAAVGSTPITPPLAHDPVQSLCNAVLSVLVRESQPAPDWAGVVTSALHQAPPPSLAPCFAGLTTVCRAIQRWYPGTIRAVSIMICPVLAAAGLVHHPPASGPPRPGDADAGACTPAPSGVVAAAAFALAHTLTALSGEAAVVPFASLPPLASQVAQGLWVASLAQASSSSAPSSSPASTGAATGTHDADAMVDGGEEEGTRPVTDGCAALVAWLVASQPVLALAIAKAVLTHLVGLPAAPPTGVDTATMDAAVGRVVARVLPAFTATSHTLHALVHALVNLVAPYGLECAEDVARSAPVLVS
jgi:hypothetical protein